MVNDKVTILGHKGKILGYNSDLTYFQHLTFWELMDTEVESDSNGRESLPEYFDAKFYITIMYKLVKSLFF